MFDARLIPFFPDYAIDQTGTVYRVTPTIPQVTARLGPTPRPITVVWCGTGTSPKRYASVTLVPRRVPGMKAAVAVKRSVAQLMRDVWPEIEFTPDVRRLGEDKTK